MIDFGHNVQLNKLNKNMHLEKTFIWRNEYSIWKWCRQNDVLDPLKHEKWFDKISSDPSIEMYLISDCKPIGVCGFTDIDRINQRAEFSLYIATEYQRNGYAKAALKTLLSHGFMNQNLNVIWGETFAGNPAYNMFLKLGMKHDGTRRDFYYKEGQFIDAHLVSMTKDEFMGVEWRRLQM